MKKLENKIAVIYGDGAIGSAVAKAFSTEGAKIFLTGRTLTKLKQIADDISNDGGIIEFALADALDEKAVEEHMNNLIIKVGKIDISFNAIGIPYKGIQDISLTELSVDSFLLPVNTYLKSHFITAKVSARHMIKEGNGVILMHTPGASHISPPFAGGRVPAWAALEAFCQSLSVECSKLGVRTVCLLTTSIPETPLSRELWKTHAQTLGITYDQFHTIVEGNTHRKRLTSLKEFTDAAVFAASDESSAITGTVLNLTAGMIV